MLSPMKLITIPLRDFALPSPRTGSIEAHSGYGRAAADGQEIHRRVQKKRPKADHGTAPRELFRLPAEFQVSGEGR